mmetsp:Transcript_54056/g.127656  ORF Transcript_54056/g.127656 Transcript_54056/m.127656 type:complete len:441 (-) Transcript_54056:231-1553(-)
MCSELLRCRMSSWLQVDHDAQVLAKPFVGYAEGGDLHDGRVSVERMFDLGARDVLTPTNNDVLDSIDDVHKSVVVDLRDVTRAEPTVAVHHLSRGFGFVPVAEHVEGRLDTELTPCVWRRRDVVASVVDELRFDDGERFPCRPRFVRVVVSPNRTHSPVGLCESVPLARFRRLELALQLFNLAWWGWCATRSDSLQRRHVAFVEVGVLHHVLQHGGHARPCRRTFSLDEGQRVAGVPLGHEDELPSFDEAGEEDVVGARDVEEWDGTDDTGREASGHATHLPHLEGELRHTDLVADSAVALHDPFRVACGAGCVHNTRWSVGADDRIRHRSLFRLFHQCVEGHGPLSLWRATTDNTGDAEFADAGQSTFEPFGVANEDLGAAVLEAVGHLFRLPQAVERDSDGTDGCRSDVSQRPFRIVAHGDSHSVSRSDIVANHESQR